MCISRHFYDSLRLIAFQDQGCTQTTGSTLSNEGCTTATALKFVGHRESLSGTGRSEWVTEAAAGRGLNRSEIVRVTGAEPETFLQITLGRPVGDGRTAAARAVSSCTVPRGLAELQFRLAS